MSLGHLGHFWCRHTPTPFQKEKKKRRHLNILQGLFLLASSGCHSLTIPAYVFVWKTNHKLTRCLHGEENCAGDRQSFQTFCSWEATQNAATTTTRNRAAEFSIRHRRSLIYWQEPLRNCETLWGPLWFLKSYADLFGILKSWVDSFSFQKPCADRFGFLKPWLDRYGFPKPCGPLWFSETLSGPLWLWKTMCGPRFIFWNPE